ncbi:MAG: hypothetical protein AAF989_03445 [Planctomycetota bacterium]
MTRTTPSRDPRPFLLRPWIKKRGGRMLGHSLRGVVGEALFYASLFLLGVFGLALILVSRFSPVRPATFRLPDVAPEVASSGLGTWLFIFLSVVAMITGVAGLLFRLSRLGASTERRSAIRARAKQLEMIGPTADQVPKLPSVPRGRRLTDSPGERQTYRLASDSDEAGIAGPAALALLWNAAWFVLLAVVLSGLWYSRPRWVLTGLLVPGAAIGYLVLRRFISQLKRQVGLGATIVEVSDHPLVPGESYRLHVSQMGRLRLKTLKISLTCQEEAFFRQGTDVRVERHEAFHQVLLEESNLRVDPRRPWQQQLRLELPPHVMHSFVGSHNAIRWKIVVSGVSRPWPSFCRSFPVVVHPPGLPVKRSPR